MNLSLDNLASLTHDIGVPGYRRDALTAGIVHIGVGNFHRAHQAVYLDAMFNAGLDLDYALIGAGVRASDAAMRDKLAAQDWLSTVVEQSAETSSARVSGAMIDFLPPGDAEAIVRQLTDPAIRIVSLTITEGGYYIDPASGQFDPEHPDIQAEARGDAGPKTAFGVLLAALTARRAAGTAPFTVMSCDNIPHNGDVTRNAVIGLAELAHPELAAWIREQVAFPNGMVDRITPATSDREIELVANTFGIADRAPVFCEDFKQWVLEDRFPAGRPRLEAAGVSFVSDVAPYELMKIRILNGGHAVIAYPSALLDIHYVHEAMRSPLVRGFLEKIELDEIVPAVPLVPNTDLHEYFRSVERRFQNPKIADTVQRLCLDGSNRQPKFILPTLAARLQRGMDSPGLALESALWCRYCHGSTDSGATIAPNDPSWNRLQETARAARERPVAWLEMADIYGEVASVERFRADFSHALESLWAHGTQETLQRYLADAL